MTRDDMLQEVLDIQSNNILLELPTSTGKSKLALNKVKQLHDIKSNTAHSSLLIVVPKLVLINNWKDEIQKWLPNNNFVIEYTSYISLHKHAGAWDYIIFDECHHLTERCREAVRSFSYKAAILCSATVKKELKRSLTNLFNNLYIYRKSYKSAIEDNILPDPKVYLMPMTLKNDFPTEVIIKNPKATGKVIECNWYERWNYIRQKTNPVKIYCTELQYYNNMCSDINYWKQRTERGGGVIAKNKWMKLCLERLKWLSNKKVKVTQDILKHLKNYRTLTFCNNIDQTELLGKYCINSYNKLSGEYLTLFNERKIKHITTCNMLNEGVNLVQCQIGVYNNLNSSMTIIKQRAGRILRHPNPVLVIPFYKGTREEELLNIMKEDYNPERTTVITNISSIKI